MYNYKITPSCPLRKLKAVKLAKCLDDEYC